MDRIQPRITETSAPYWEGCREGELRLQFCGDCARHQFYPRTFCVGCGGSLAWQVASGLGRIASFSVVHRGVSSAYPAPYVVALIDLEEGPRMMSHVVDANPEEVEVGAAVTVEFQTWSEENELPVFRLLKDRVEVEGQP